MNKNQEIKILLLEKFGISDEPKSVAFCREAYRFMMEDEPAGTPACEIRKPETGKPGNGTYFVYQNGDYVSCGTDNPRLDGVVMIGVVHDGHSFGVPLDGDYGCHRLLKKDSYPVDEYCRNECDALLDWDFVGQTNHLKELGLAFDLKDNHFLPTAAVWLAIYANREAINSALLSCGADTINFNDDYWFAERNYANGSWIFYGTYGSLHSSYVGSSYRARAVTLWDIL